MMYDNRVIADQGTPGGLQVLAHRQEVMWRDGTRVLLCPVLAGGRPMYTLRAVALADGRLQVVDLEKLSAALGLALRTSPARDAQGLVYFTLRHKWGSAAAFLADANRCAKGAWNPSPAGMVWAPAARSVDSEVLATAELAALAPTQAAAWCPR